jgi:hypothetical protein
MQFLRASIIGFFLTASLLAQSSVPTSSATPTSRPVGTLNEVMRGIYFPNSNLIFDVQVNDPGAAKATVGKPGSATRYASVYTRWEELEYAAVALIDGVDLILAPGRACQNGMPVPVSQADYRRFAQEMRKVGLSTLEAVRTKNREKVIDATDGLTQACSNCHQVFRSGQKADSPNRCTARATK